MIYVASPYTHDDLAVMQARFEQVAAFTVRIISHGAPAFSPIVHCHQLAIDNDMPKDFVFWKSYCLSMLRKSDLLYVCMIDGWQESIGVEYEIEYAEQNGIGIGYFTVDGMVDGGAMS